MLDELGAHVRTKKISDSRVLLGRVLRRRSTSGPLLVKPSLRQHLARSRSGIVIVLLMLAVWATVYGVAYLLDLTGLR